MTLELLMKQDEKWLVKCYNPFLLHGVQDITDQTEYGKGHFAITIFDRRVFLTETYEYVKDADTGKYYVKDGKWVGDNIDFSFNIKGYEQNEKGEYTGFVTTAGFALQYQDEDGNPIPLNKEAIERFLRGTKND